MVQLVFQCLGSASAADSGVSAVAGSAACRECHPVFHERWEHSRHGASVVSVSKAWAARELGVLPAELSDSPDERFRLGWGDRALEMTVEENGGKPERLTADFALGGRDLWYLLGELGGDRLQVLPMAYDRRREEWFNPASSASRPHQEEEAVAGLNWRSPAYTFNDGCYACHVSGAGRSDAGPGSGATRWWEEPGIRCESCHGPGGEHVRAFREARESGRPAVDLKIIAAGDFTGPQIEGLCGSCHAKLAPIGGPFLPGNLFADHFDLALWEDTDFAVDGREQGETYTMTSWLSNRCAERGGLDCLHCHTSSGRNRFPGEAADAACQPCHEERVAGSEQHSRHPAGEPGGRCVDCHMPVTEFARMRRHDHSFRPPTPAVTVEFGSPNACSGCHGDRGAAWADLQVRQWHGADYQAPVIRRARWLDRARKQDWSALDGLLQNLEEEHDEPVYVASMIRLLGPCDDERKLPVMIRALAHPSPWVQASAAQGLAGQLRAGAVPGLVRLAGGPTRLLRLRAAEALVSLPDGVLESREQVTVDRALRELEDQLRLHSDDVSGMEALGHFYLDRGEAVEGARWLERALEREPGRLALMVSAGTAHYRAGDRDRAGLRFQGAVEVHPESGLAWLNWVRYLELCGQTGKVEEARRVALGRLRGNELRRFERGFTGEH